MRIAMARQRIISKVVIVAIILVLLKLWSLPEKYHQKDHRKYILQWTKPYTIPFKHLGNGQDTFLRRNCPTFNCFVTSNRKYFSDIRDFDAILFHGPEILQKNIEIPEKRSSNQKYVFVSIESPHYYFDCTPVYSNFFNWTWTYKLNSDVPFNYLAVRDRSGKIIGPAKDIKWINITNMQSTKEVLKKKLERKKTAVAWFSSNCNSLSKREKVAADLQSELDLYNLTVDTYGACGKFKCDVTDKKCWEMVQKGYFFYLAFENSFALDYVTEKLSNALNHYVVPVVYGMADYKRFMPDGIYLDIKTLGVKEVARKISESINDRDKYYEYFKWHNHYTYEETNIEGQAPDSDSYCKLCEMLNDQSKMLQNTIYDRFDQWWNMGSFRCITKAPTPVWVSTPIQTLINNISW